jgi:hypothetical protein
MHARMHPSNPASHEDRFFGRASAEANQTIGAREEGRGGKRQGKKVGEALFCE